MQRSGSSDTLIVLSGLCISSWALGYWTSEVSILNVPVGDPIFLQFNPMFWLSVLLAAGVFAASSRQGKNRKASAVAISILVVILGVTPYLVEAGQTYDAYMYYGFSSFIAQTGHIPAPQASSTLVYFEWPGLFLFGAALLLVSNVGSEILVKSYEFANLALFGLGIYLLGRAMLRDEQKARLSVVLVFLGSSLTFYDFSPNWSTFALGPLFLVASLRRDTRWRVISAIFFAYVVVTHPFNGLMLLMIIAAMHFGQRLFGGTRSYQTMPFSIVSYLAMYLAWAVFVGTFIVKSGYKALFDAYVLHTGATGVSILIGHLNLSELVRRLMLVLVVLSLLWVVVVNRSRRDLDGERTLCWPTGLMLAITLVIPYFIREPFFWGRTFAYSMLLGFLVVGSLTQRVVLRSSPKNARNAGIRRAALTMLFVSLLIGSYTLSYGGGTTGFAVPVAYMRASQFLQPSLQEGSTVMISPAGDLYSVISNRLDKVTVSGLSDERLAYSKAVEFIVVRKQITAWYLALDPVSGHIHQRVENYAESGQNRIYDNKFVQIYRS